MTIWTHVTYTCELGPFDVTVYKMQKLISNPAIT